MAKSFATIMKEYEENISDDIKLRTGFIQEQVEKAWMKGVVVGISGGIDSSVVAALAIKALGPSKVLGVWMPAQSDPVHERDALELSQAIGLKLINIDLNKAVDELVQAVDSGLRTGEYLSGDNMLTKLSIGNTKARVRMAALYAVANQLGYMVLGTCNRTEIYLGYETKGGDQICDFNPIASLLKAQVRILAKALGIPENIINKAPSADLWEGHTDEGEMGFTYAEADRAILTGEGDPDILRKIDQLHRCSEHKRTMAPTV